MKIYKCSICHKTLDYKPIRLVKQEYGIGKYNQYTGVTNYDFCKRCYQVFDKWIRKYEVINDKKDINV